MCKQLSCQLGDLATLPHCGWEGVTGGRTASRCASASARGGALMTLINAMRICKKKKIKYTKKAARNAARRHKAQETEHVNYRHRKSDKIVTVASRALRLWASPKRGRGQGSWGKWSAILDGQVESTEMPRRKSQGDGGPSRNWSAENAAQGRSGVKSVGFPFPHFFLVTLLFFLASPNGGK